MATEKWLIDANELLEKHTCDVYGAYDDSCLVQAVFVPYIKGAPTVDAVEVVRCNACQSHEPCEVKGRVWCRKLRRYMNEDGFCSEGNTDA